MDFACIILFLFIYYLKPQEWTSLLASVRFVQLTMIASLISLFMRERSLKLRDFFRTPHDWAMLLFFGWVVIASPTPVDTFKEFLNRLVFYVVTLHTLVSWERIKRYLGWWTGVMVGVAALALVSEYIIDPLGSRDITHGIMKDRLVLNISMVNNPNALGHTVVAAIPMLYFFCIWKRPLFMKEVGLVLLAIPFGCVYLTYSKGAYLAGAITVVATLLFGRPKIVQGVILAIVLIGGITAVQSLPRMNELQKTKTDEAIQGRIIAFTYGRQYYSTLNQGVGQGQFINSLLRDHNYYKAAHSTYVQTGAELGRTGMFLFLLVLWTGARTLLTAKTHNEEQERIRRILFVLLLAYCVSGWMVDFAYRAHFFMFMAAIAAFHRLLYLPAEETVEAEKPDQEPLLEWRPAVLAPVPAEGEAARASAEQASVAVATPQQPQVALPWLREPQPGREIASEQPPEKEPWMRFGFLDLVATIAFLYVIERIWSYAIVNI